MTARALNRAIAISEPDYLSATFRVQDRWTRAAPLATVRLLASIAYLDPVRDARNSPARRIRSRRRRPDQRRGGDDRLGRSRRRHPDRAVFGRPDAPSRRPAERRRGDPGQRRARRGRARASTPGALARPGFEPLDRAAVRGGVHRRATGPPDGHRHALPYQRLRSERPRPRPRPTCAGRLWKRRPVGVKSRESGLEERRRRPWGRSLRGRLVARRRGQASQPADGRSLAKGGSLLARGRASHRDTGRRGARRWRIGGRSSSSS